MEHAVKSTFTSIVDLKAMGITNQAIIQIPFQAQEGIWAYYISSMEFKCHWRFLGGLVLTSNYVRDTTIGNNYIPYEHVSIVTNKSTEIYNSSGMSTNILCSAGCQALDAINANITDLDVLYEYKPTNQPNLCLLSGEQNIAIQLVTGPNLTPIQNSTAVGVTNAIADQNNLNYWYLSMCLVYIDFVRIK